MYVMTLTFLVQTTFKHQEEARVEIVEEAANQGFVVEDTGGQIVVDPVTEP